MSIDTTRRDFLKLSAGTAAALGIGGRLPTPTPPGSRPEERAPRVSVVLFNSPDADVLGLAGALDMGIASEPGSRGNVDWVFRPNGRHLTVDHLAVVMDGRVTATQPLGQRWDLFTIDEMVVRLE